MEVSACKPHDFRIKSADRWWQYFVWAMFCMACIGRKSYGYGTLRFKPVKPQVSGHGPTCSYLFLFQVLILASAASLSAAVRGANKPWMAYYVKT